MADKTHIFYQGNVAEMVRLHFPDLFQEAPASQDNGVIQWGREEHEEAE